MKNEEEDEEMKNVRVENSAQKTDEQKKSRTPQQMWETSTVPL